MRGVPLVDALDLRRKSLRTRVGLLVLTALVAGFALASFVLLRNSEARTAALLPAGSDAIVVLDLSASIDTDTYSRIGLTLTDLARSRARVGLVVFSDQAYEALPPGVPASTLEPLIRYFTLPKQVGGAAPAFPPNPWVRSFSAGTRIAAGLELAHGLALDQRRKPTVVLISDLDDSPSDLPRLTGIVLAYARDKIPLKVVGLNPSLSDQNFFTRLLGPGAATHIIPAASPLQPPSERTTAPFPWAAVLAVVGTLLALAALLLASARLEVSE
ncbi:MAG TPA: vWA domain-containing protein [Gaiellaceae bacterium]|nr:vWA domain-containing protein [Gaiellaceae bacterium]